MSQISDELVNFTAVFKNIFSDGGLPRATTSYDS